MLGDIWWWWWHWEPLRYYCSDWESWTRCITAPVINNQALVAARQLSTFRGVCQGTRDYARSDVSGEQTSFFIFLPLIYTDSPAHSVNTMKLTFTQSLHLEFRRKQNLSSLREKIIWWSLIYLRVLEILENVFMNSIYLFAKE